MSWQPLMWALTVKAPSAKAKHLLIEMANIARYPDPQFFASVQTLAERSQIDRKTIPGCLDALEAVGLISKIGARAGRGGAWTYRLNMPAGAVADADGSSPETGPTSGSGEASEVGPNFPGSWPNSESKLAQFSLEVGPNLGDKTYIHTETVLKQEEQATRKKTKRSSSLTDKSQTVAQPSDVTAQVWKDWSALRAKKRAPITETVMVEARSEAGKAGLPLERFLAIWCVRGSQGLQADWLKPSERQAAGTYSSPGAGTDYREGLNDQGLAT